MTIPNLHKPAPLTESGPVLQESQGKRKSCVASHTERFVSFTAIGLFSTLLDTGLLIILAEFFGIWYLWSATASYFCGILASYYLNRRYTFHDRAGDCAVRFAVFALISISSLAINLIVIFTTVEILSFNYLAGKMAATGLSFFWNYIGQNRITFHT